MKNLDLIENLARLARLARKAKPPSVDVADGVMRRLTEKAGAEPPASFWPLAAAVSLATAASFFFALRAWLAARDPLVELVSSVGAVLR